MSGKRLLIGGKVTDWTTLEQGEVLSVSKYRARVRFPSGIRSVAKEQLTRQHPKRIKRTNREQCGICGAPSEAYRCSSCLQRQKRELQIQQYRDSLNST